MTKVNTILLIVAVFGIGGSIFYLESLKPQRISSRENTVIPPIPSGSEPVSTRPTAKNFPRAIEIVHPSGFVNTDTITITDLIGKKVILVDFWTYSCINCQRTTPYLNAWYEKYKDKGLEIIGVHTPEFQFEQKYENVRAAVNTFGIRYPVVLDNDYGTWSAYGNRYWPHKYLIDIDGFIVYDHIGEGAYEETERKIQELLQERTAVLGMRERIDTAIVKPAGTAAADVSKPTSPELYFGAARNSELGNGKSGTPGAQVFSEPSEVKTNTLYLAGQWNFEDEFAENTSVGAKILLRYQARSVYFVASATQPVPLKVFRDGKPLTNAAGEDVTQDGASTATIKDDRLYKLIEDSEYGEHTLEVIIEGKGLRAFTFTFG